jgi:hypothetical protein
MLEKILKRSKPLVLSLALASSCATYEIKPETSYQDATIDRHQTISTKAFRGEIVYEKDEPYLKIKGFDLQLDKITYYKQKFEVVKQNKYKVESVGNFILPYLGAWTGAAVIGCGAFAIAGEAEFGCELWGALWLLVGVLPMSIAIGSMKPEERRPEWRFVETISEERKLVGEEPIDEKMDVIDRRPIKKEKIHVKSDELKIDTDVEVVNGLAAVKLNPNEYVVNMKEIKRQVQQVAPGCNAYAVYNQLPSFNVYVEINISQEKGKALKFPVEAKQFDEEKLLKAFEEACEDYLKTP